MVYVGIYGSVCHRRRKSICTCGIVMENSVVSCSQLGENAFIVSVHSNSICPCALTASFLSILQHRTEWKKSEKKMRESVEEALSFEDDACVLQKWEAQYSGAYLNDHPSVVKYRIILNLLRHQPSGRFLNEDLLCFRIVLSIDLVAHIPSPSHPTLQNFVVRLQGWHRSIWTWTSFLCH